MTSRAPIGVFDSGIGGVSVLRALLAALPGERFVYAGDSAHAPYGEQGDAHVIARSEAVLASLRRRYGIKAFVIACNTATAAAGRTLRERHPDLPIIGIEPALKPATLVTRTKRVGVMATRVTLASQKFRDLHERLSGPVEFILRACDGLASAIEKEALTEQQAQTDALINQHVGALGPLGDAPGQIDTLVLGCTHYPLVAARIQRQASLKVNLIDPGEAVARHTRDILTAKGLLAAAPPSEPVLELLDSGDGQSLGAAVAKWLEGPARSAVLQPFSV